MVGAPLPLLASGREGPRPRRCKVGEGRGASSCLSPRIHRRSLHRRRAAPGVVRAASHPLSRRHRAAGTPATAMAAALRTPGPLPGGREHIGLEAEFAGPRPLRVGASGSDAGAMAGEGYSARTVWSHVSRRAIKATRVLSSAPYHRLPRLGRKARSRRASDSRLTAFALRTTMSEDVLRSSGQGVGEAPGALCAAVHSIAPPHRPRNGSGWRARLQSTVVQVTGRELAPTSDGELACAHQSPSATTDGR